MNLVSYCLLVSAGLLAPPALAETSGLRGGVQAEVDAENDLAAIRALSHAFSFSYPVDPGIPDHPPGHPIDLPPGAFITKQKNYVSQTLVESVAGAAEFTSLRRKKEPLTDDDAYYYSSFFNGKGAGNALRAEETDQYYNYKRKGPGAFRLRNDRYKTHEQDFINNDEVTNSVFRVKGDQMGADGFYSNGKLEFSGTAEDFKVVEQDYDENGPYFQYYYRDQSRDRGFASETEFHEYDFDFEFSIP